MSLVASGRSILSGAGHAAVWVSLYVAGCTVCLTDLGGGTRQWRAIATAMLIALSIYILDRVKLNDARLDPADRLAHPERFDFVSRHAPALRIVAALAGLAALAFAVSMHWTAPLACLVAYAGVLLYAGGRRRAGPHRARVKDRLLIKNVYVAGGITGLCALLVASGGPVRWREGGIAASVVFLLVLGDSILCDIPDAGSDERFGTHTLPNVVGPQAAWAVALACQIGSLMLVWSAGVGEGVLWSAPALWPASVVATTVLLMIMRPAHLRDIVDARLGAFGAIALLAG